MTVRAIQIVRLCRRFGIDASRAAVLADLIWGVRHEG